ncbi:hypothetical protein DFH06DRAFT_1123401 [Mycena polygramma]|nr:hypothetical protein DFH06DRAFT_1123401 [Mycena polygramma]
MFATLQGSHPVADDNRENGQVEVDLKDSPNRQNKAMPVGNRAGNPHRPSTGGKFNPYRNGCGGVRARFAKLQRTNNNKCVYTGEIRSMELDEAYGERPQLRAAQESFVATLNWKNNNQCPGPSTDRSALGQIRGAGGRRVEVEGAANCCEGAARRNFQSSPGAEDPGRARLVLRLTLGCWKVQVYMRWTSDRGKDKTPYSESNQGEDFGTNPSQQRCMSRLHFGHCAESTSIISLMETEMLFTLDKLQVTRNQIDFRNDGKKLYTCPGFEIQISLLAVDRISSQLKGASRRTAFLIVSPTSPPPIMSSHTILVLTLATTPVYAYYMNNGNYHRNTASRIIAAVVGTKGAISYNYPVIVVFLVLLGLCLLAQRRRRRAFPRGYTPGWGGFSNRWGMSGYPPNGGPSYYVSDPAPAGVGGKYPPPAGEPAPPPYTGGSPQTVNYAPPAGPPPPPQGSYEAPGTPPPAHVHDQQQQPGFVGGFRS